MVAQAVFTHPIFTFLILTLRSIIEGIAISDTAWHLVKLQVDSFDTDRDGGAP